jgi:hypothetical protein
MAPILMYSKVSKIALRRDIFVFGCLIKVADKNKSATAYKHTYGNDLGDTSRSYPEDGMTSGTIGARNGEASQGVEQRRTQDN